MSRLVVIDEEGLVMNIVDRCGPGCGWCCEGGLTVNSLIIRKSYIFI